MAVAIVCAGISAGQLQRTFPCLGPTIAEERAIKAGDFHQPLCQFSLILVIEQIRRVNQFSGLLFQNFLNCGMPMPQRIYTNAAEKIQIALTFRIPQINAAAASEKYFLPVVGRQQQFLFVTHYGSQAHAPMTSVPYSSFWK